LDRRTGEVVKTLTAHGDESVTGLRFSPDASRLVSAGSDWTVRLWDTKTWQNVSTVRLTRNWSFETWWNHALVTFSPDGLYYAFCFQQERVAQVRSCRDGALAWECAGHRDGVQALEFDATSQYLWLATRSGLVYRYPAIPILRGEQASPRELLPDEYASYVLDEAQTDHGAQALAYRLEHCAKHQQAPIHELNLLLSALCREDLGDAHRAALAVARRLVQRLPACRRAQIALGLALFRAGDQAAAIEQLDRGGAGPAAAPPDGSDDRTREADELVRRAAKALARTARGERDGAMTELEALREAANDPTTNSESLRLLIDELARATRR
jgi:hypothetical protein